MQKFSPLAYIRQFQAVIIAGALIAGLVFYEYFASIQDYTVSALIEYTNSRAVEGYSPDGKEIDTSEIYSGTVMQDVFDRMGLDYDQYNLDQFRSRVVVTPQLTDEEKAVQEAQNDNGEETTIKPTRYKVSFTATREDSDKPADFARRVLDNMLDAFLAEYAENHLGGGSVANTLASLYTESHDYLEMIEIVEDGVQDTLDLLYNQVAAVQNSAMYYYRSALTGYSFMDLYREFDTISKTDIPNIYAYILNNRVTKDRAVLMSKYQNRIRNFQISNAASSQEANSIMEIIDSYVRMMRESGNTNITFEYILDNVDDNYYRYIDQSEDGQSVRWERPDDTVKYDVLLDDYVKNRTTVENDLIEIAYCQYIIDVFLGNVSTTGDGDTVTAADANAEETVTAMLDSTVSRLNELYSLLDRTFVEFNEYAGAMNISLGSNVILEPGMQLVLYSGIVIVAFAILLSIAVIVLSRVGEIFNFYVYTDPKFMIPNRSACDRYMEGYANRTLPENMTCISISVPDVRRKNDQYGVDVCDAMLRKLVEIVQSAFSGIGESFLSVNGLGQFIVFAKNTSYGQAEACMDYVCGVVADYNREADCRISYRCGIAESGTDSLYQIKPLLMKAIEKCTDAREEDGSSHGNRTERRAKNKNRRGNEPVRTETDDQELDDLLERLEKARKDS